jgi:hypothetical protein
MARIVVLFAALFAVAVDEPKLKPDPPAKAVEWPATLPAFDLPAGTYSTHLLAEHAGPFMLTNGPADKGTTRAVYDLRTGKPVGRWTSDDPPTTWHALSRDGKLYVAKFYGKRPMPGVPPTWLLAAFDTATGKRLWEVELASVAYRVLFAGPDRIVVERGMRGNGPMLYDAKTGKLVRELPAGDGSVTHCAVSPGGAYLAWSERHTTVNVVRAEDGAAVTQFAIPQPQPGQTWLAMELSFSPDGARLAAVLRGTLANDRSYRILSWDLATGEQDADAQLPGPTAYSNPMLQWSVDSKAWFVSGVGMVDPDTGAVLWRPAFDPREVALHLPLAAHRLLKVNRLGAVREIGLPREKVAAALKAVRAGGMAVDGWLPALAKADRSAAQAVTLPPRADDWTYQPDPAPATDPRKPLRLPLPADQMGSAHVVGPAAVFELVEPSADLLAPRRLVRMDLATGKPTGTVKLPHVARLADVAPDGAAALTVDSEDGRRVDVWDLDTGKPVAGWRPALVREPGGELLYASLLSADRVLTLTRGGELAVWSVPGAKAVYTARVPGLGVPARSPGRKYLFALQGDVVRVIEAATGRLAGDLPADAAPAPTYTLPPGPWAHPPLAVRPDGQELVALLAQPAGAGPQVRRWDLTTAKLTDRSPFPGTGVTPTTAVRYAGPDHLLVADTELFGLTSRAIEWRYVRPAMAHPAASADGRYWYVAGGFASPSAAAAGAAAAHVAAPAVLVAVELPHPTAVAALKAASDNTADNLLGPGKTVGLKLDLADAPNDKVRESVRATLADALATRGLRATDGRADVVLTASARVTPDGPKLTVRKLLPGEKGPGTAESVAVPYLATRLELTADGRPVWTGGEVQMSPPLNPQPFRLPDKDTDLTAWLRERAWARLSDNWGKLSLPRTLIRTPGGLVMLPGASVLGPGGPRPAPGKND